MAAVIFTLVLSVLLAIGVAFAASFSHRLANSPELRRQVRLKWEDALLKLDDAWVKVVDVTEPHRVKLNGLLTRAKNRRARGRRHVEPAEQSSRG